jgi:bifunctional aspartokinase / homoserine dehydrogenase 1
MTVTVMYFGPADMSGGDAIVLVADTLAAERQNGKQIVAIVTAMAGVSDMLLDSIRHGNYASVYTKLLASHTSAARRLARDESARKVLIQDVTDILDSYNWLGKSLANRSATPAESDNIATLGERLSARLLAANLQGRGIQTVTLNAAELLTQETGVDAQSKHVRAKLTPLLDQQYLLISTASFGVEVPAVKLETILTSTFQNPSS